MYDERLQQVSQNFLAGVAQMASCSSTPGSPANTCFLDFILATLAAHSYKFIAQVPGGQHNVTATWSIVNASASNGASVGACLGPGNVTVTQNQGVQQQQRHPAGVVGCGSELPTLRPVRPLRAKLGSDRDNAAR